MQRVLYGELKIVKISPEMAKLCQVLRMFEPLFDQLFGRLTSTISPFSKFAWSCSSRELKIIKIGRKMANLSEKEKQVVFESKPYRKFQNAQVSSGWYEGEKKVLRLSKEGLQSSSDAFFNS